MLMMMMMTMMMMVVIWMTTTIPFPTYSICLHLLFGQRRLYEWNSVYSKVCADTNFTRGDDISLESAALVTDMIVQWEQNFNCRKWWLLFVFQWLLNGLSARPSLQRDQPDCFVVVVIEITHSRSSSSRFKVAMRFSVILLNLDFVKRFDCLNRWHKHSNYKALWDLCICP